MAILNMSGGGGGGLSATDALLRVQAPAGSTVTISKGGVTKTDAGHENADDHTVYDYYFIIHASQFDSVNPWTVTATLGAESASDTVTIDSADEYDVELFYHYYLFRSGAGDSSQWTAYPQGNTKVTVGTDSIKIEQQGSGGSQYLSMQYKTLLDLSGYTTLTVDYNFTSFPIAGSNTTRAFGIANSLRSSQGDYSWKGYTTFPQADYGTRKTLTLDVTSLSDGYFAFEGSMRGDIFNVYLD